MLQREVIKVIIGLFGLWCLRPLLTIFQSCTVLMWHFFYNRNWVQRCQLGLAQNLELKWLLLIYFSRKELSKQYRIKSLRFEMQWEVPFQQNISLIVCLLMIFQIDMIKNATLSITHRNKHNMICLYQFVAG